MSNIFVCHKCLNPIQNDDICKKSNFEYFHMACIKNDGLDDVTDQIPDYNQIPDSNNINNNEIFKLKTDVNKFGGKFIDLSSKEKILEIYKNESLKKNLEKELTELEQVDIDELYNNSLNDFINELNKKIEQLDNNYLNIQLVN